jgi:hypothetical protein
VILRQTGGGSLLIGIPSLNGKRESLGTRVGEKARTGGRKFLSGVGVG